MSISGKFLSASVGGTPIDGTHEWSVNETADRLEATAGSNNGRGNKNAGVIDTKIKIRFYLDVAAGRAGFIRAGTVLTSLELFADSDSPTPIYAIGQATVYDSNVAGQVRDRFIVDADIEANGDVVTFNDPG